MMGVRVAAPFAKSNLFRVAAKVEADGDDVAYSK